MLKIVYDHQIFWCQKYGGISRYIYELATHLFDSDACDVKILALAYVNEYLKKLKPGLVVGFPVPIIPKTGRVIKTFNSELSKILLKSNPPDILHNTFYYPEKLAPKGTRVVTTVHDMTDEKFYPENPMCQRKSESVRQADHIICVSENTKKDLIEILDVAPNKVSVVYHGYSFKVEQNYQPDVKNYHPYILYIGDRKGYYKNFQRLLQAYASSSQLRNCFNLVCFGDGKFSHNELSLINKLGIPEDKIVQVSGDDIALSNIYRGASVFVYPSLYEGFGIPLLEAMSLRCPVACSNTSSMPEVAGNAAEFFDPYETESIADAIEKVLYSPERAQNLVTLGLERIKRFSWKVCAEQTRLVYSALL